MEISRWPILWLLLSGLVQLWDVCFVIFRPHSLPGGSLHHFFTPYALYIQVDKPYGDMKDEFVWAQSWLNLIEVCLLFVTVFLTLLKSPRAMVLGLVVSVMTFWKTLLYMIQYSDMCCAGGHQLKHLEVQTALMLFVIPNGFWLVFPFILILYYSRKLSLLLDQKSQAKQD